MSVLPLSVGRSGLLNLLDTLRGTRKLITKPTNPMSRATGRLQALITESSGASP
jgi:hypothetical protein